MTSTLVSVRFTALMIKIVLWYGPEDAKPGLVSRDECSCGEREHNEHCASSKGGDPNSDKGSSTEGDRSHDIDDYRQYSR